MISEQFAEFRIRLSRGQALFYDVKNALMIATAIKILLNTSLLTTFLLTLGAMVGFFLIGFLDLKYFKIMQEEARLTTSKYNPHLNNIRKI